MQFFLINENIWFSNNVKFKEKEKMSKHFYYFDLIKRLQMWPFSINLFYEVVVIFIQEV